MATSSLIIFAGIVAVQACDRNPASGARTEVSAAMNADDLAQQKDLAERLEALGDRSIDDDDDAAARTAYESAKSIRVRLLLANPNDTHALEAAATVYTKLGEALMAVASHSVAQPEPDAYDPARAAFEAARDIRKQLREAEPQHLGRLRALADSYSDLISPCMNHCWQAALDASGAALDIRKRLSEAAPHEPEIWHALRHEYDRHAFLLLARASDADSPAETVRLLRQSRETYEAALDAAHRASKIDPSYRAQLAGGYARLGAACRREGQLHEALHAYDAALALDRQLLPGDAALQDATVLHHQDRGSVLEQLGDYAAAVAAHEAAVALREKMSQAEPGDRFAAERLVFDYEKLGDVQAEAGRKVSANRSFETAFALADRLRAAGEDVTDQLRSLQSKLGHSSDPRSE